MAITPRTILTQPAPAAVAAVALFGATVFGTGVYDALTPMTYDQGSTCEKVAEMIGSERSDWTERAWITYASCYDQRNQSRKAIEAAGNGLEAYPHSEALWNMKGYHEILLEEHQQAVKTLSAGLQLVESPKTGTMHNNLAWAGLWTGNMPTEKMRGLYHEALARNPESCEMIHTGLFVEFQAARHSGDLKRAMALKRFQQLRRTYGQCVPRVADGRWITLTEVGGAGVLFEKVDEMLGIAPLGKRKSVHALTDKTGTDNTLPDTATQLRANFRGSSIGAFCREAMPMTDMVDECVETIDRSVTRIRRMEEQTQRVERKRNPHVVKRGAPKPIKCFITKGDH